MYQLHKSCVCVCVCFIPIRCRVLAELNTLLPTQALTPTTWVLVESWSAVPHTHRWPLALAAGYLRGSEECSVSASRKIEHTCEHLLIASSIFQGKSQGSWFTETTSGNATSQSTPGKHMKYIYQVTPLCQVPEDRKVSEINILPQICKGCGHIISCKGWDTVLVPPEVP